MCSSDLLSLVSIGILPRPVELIESGPTELIQPTELPRPTKLCRPTKLVCGCRFELLGSLILKLVSEWIRRCVLASWTLVFSFSFYLNQS
mgnify:CR=1 FL=1